MSPWRKKISKALLQREINSQVNEFASGICESLEYLKENIQRAIGEIDDVDKISTAAYSLMSTLDYIDELIRVLKCAG